MPPSGRRRKKAAACNSTGAPATRGTTADPAAAGPVARQHTLVVGIGASAGGLEALKAFFGAMPPASGLVFVVVVHLDPTHESLMPELLAKSTTLSVEQARDRQPLEVDHVYVIPPNRTLTLQQGLLRVQEVADRRGLRGSIDHFFRSLAAGHGANAVGIVLSGTGTEGTLGARAIKAEGGLVMAQAPETASQPGMPVSAIETGLVDFVMPPEEMPHALLVRRERNRTAARSPPESHKRSRGGEPIAPGGSMDRIPGADGENDSNHAGRALDPRPEHEMRLAAQLDVPVLTTARSREQRDLCARFIHAISSCWHGAFVTFPGNGAGSSVEAAGGLQTPSVRAKPAHCGATSSWLAEARSSLTTSPR